MREEISFSYFALQSRQKSTMQEITEAKACVKEIKEEIIKLEAKKAENIKVTDAGKKQQKKKK